VGVLHLNRRPILPNSHFAEKISFVIPHIRTLKIPGPQLHKQIVDKTPK
jgi:hypothetical protein